MMSDLLLLQWIGAAMLLLGTFFVFTGALGLLRMPDFFTRLHPAGIVDAAGIPLILLGLMLISGFTLFSAKIFILLLFLLLASPTACHALAKAAYLARDEKKKSKAEKGEPR